ncbi:MAG: hypothetical protein IJC24_03880 [Clostridia bacterium]|nr:hypothetical protein [Clostridia bacterium]
MKRLICIVLICMLSIALVACAKEQPKEDQWEITVPCAEESQQDSYVISYGGVTVASETGILTLQNRNDFEITVHLSCNGQEEQVFDIQPGGVTVFHQAVKGEAYTVGIHAEVKEGTEIKLMVYDGERAEVY